MSLTTTNNFSTTNGLSSSSDETLNQLYSTYDTQLSSPDSSCSSNIDPPKAYASSSSQHKESTSKLLYPVLSDRRDPSSVLSLLQKETQTTSKKILEVTEIIENCEKKLPTNHLLDIERKSLKYECVKRKQQLDALKKHERRVNLQIDYITTKTEIQGLDDEQKQICQKTNSTKNKQIEILSRKLKQKLDQMKIYMRQRNDQMKKLTDGKQQLSTSNDGRKQLPSDQKIQSQLSASDLNRKRSLSVTSDTHSNKHFKSTTRNHPKPPVIRLASRSSNHQPKSQPLQTPTVRFLTKTTDSTINSASPTTPASSSSTLSPPLIASTSTGDANNNSKSIKQNVTLPIHEDGELDVEFDVDELFADDSYSTESTKRFTLEKREFKFKQNTAKTES